MRLSREAVAICIRDWMQSKRLLGGVTRMGFPPRARFDHKIIGQDVFPLLFFLLSQLDATLSRRIFGTLLGTLTRSRHNHWSSLV